MGERLVVAMGERLRHMHTYIHIDIHADIHADIHTYIHTYIYTYIHTYAQVCGRNGRGCGGAEEVLAPRASDILHADSPVVI